MMDFTLTLQASAETTEKVTEQNTAIRYLSLIHISEPTRPVGPSRMPSSA